MMNDSPWANPIFKRLMNIQDDYTFLSEFFSFYDQDLFELFMSEPKFAQRVESITSERDSSVMKQIKGDEFKEEALEEAEYIMEFNSFVNSASIDDLQEDLNFAVDSLYGCVLYKESHPEDKHVNDSIEEFSREAKLLTEKLQKEWK